MAVQDDVRERELCRTFGLHWDQAHARGGDDASLTLEIAAIRYRFFVEVKSTTGSTVSTARDVGMEHIRRWRSKLFVIGFYDHVDKRPELKRVMCLTPIDMAPWIDSIAAKVEPDYKIAQLASRRLELSDLYEVCGEKTSYSLDDAKRLHKQQWSAEQYQAAVDLPGSLGGQLSPGAMLEILRLRARYIAQRGATLNNPHITSEHLRQFWDTDRAPRLVDAVPAIRKMAADFVAANPEHPAFSVVP